MKLSTNYIQQGKETDTSCHFPQHQQGTVTTVQTQHKYNNNTAAKEQLKKGRKEGYTGGRLLFLFFFLLLLFQSIIIFLSDA